MNKVKTKNRSAEIEALIREMTLEEKAALCGGDGHWHTNAIKRLGLDRAMMTDGPHGLRKVVQADGKTVQVPAACFPTGVRAGRLLEPGRARGRGGGHRRRSARRGRFHGAGAGRQHEAFAAVRAEF